MVLSLAIWRRFSRGNASAFARCPGLSKRNCDLFLTAESWPTGKQQHTKYSRSSTPSDVTVTRRHHPLLGQRLNVVSGGASAIVVRIADGTTMRIPRVWTDADGASPHESPKLFSASRH